MHGRPHPPHPPLGPPATDIQLRINRHAVTWQAIACHCMRSHGMSSHGMAESTNMQYCDFVAKPSTSGKHIYIHIYMYIFIYKYA